MKTFLNHVTDTDTQELDEANLLRSVSALVLLKRILDRSTKARNSTDTNEQLRLIASQNSHLAAMIYAMTQLLPDKRKRFSK
tara:strand:+ start:481 stop:726 length:246 start_codon:yes stop_codon:yes gene_type:complete